MIVYHHDKDMDGYTSGAIMKHKFPHAELRGWDYAYEVPEIAELTNKVVYLIDVTFPLEVLQELGMLAEKLVVIDHHISFKKQVDALKEDLNFEYVYDGTIAACEIGWKYCFPNTKVPEAIKLISKYDTWQNGDKEEWNNRILPFKYFMYGQTNRPDNFPVELLEPNTLGEVGISIEIGKGIMEYEDTINESLTAKFSFEKEVFDGLNALCINHFPFGSQVVQSAWNPEIHDLMVGFCYVGNKWSVSLRSEGDMDVSEIARSRGGGGHKNAAGFEVDNFEDIFK